MDLGQRQLVDGPRVALVVVEEVEELGGAAGRVKKINPKIEAAVRMKAGEMEGKPLSKTGEYHIAHQKAGEGIRLPAEAQAFPRLLSRLTGPSPFAGRKKRRE